MIDDHATATSAVHPGTVVGDGATASAGAPHAVPRGGDGAAMARAVDLAPDPSPVGLREPRRSAAPDAPPSASPAEAPEPQASPPGETLEIPYAIRWLVPRGERFANFDILNDNDSQLDYYRRFGHIYAVGVPTKKWRLVVVSDPDLLDEVASNEEQFGKRVEEINFFTQLAKPRGGGISVIGDGPHYDQVRRVMLPWYSPRNQRTQLEQMKAQARKLVDAWASLPGDEPVDARSWMERYALEVSGRGACNYDFGLLEADRPPHAFAAAVPDSTKESIRRVVEPWPDPPFFAARSSRQRARRFDRQNRELFETAEALVAARVHTAPQGTQTDLLTRLVTTPDPDTGAFLDPETIRDQVLMHMSNGFNGPSITGAWLAYVLATRPDIEERVLAEIDGITGGDPDHDLAYEDLMRMTYTTQVIKETLRIYPPMPVTIRRSLRDGTLGRYRIRKGDVVLVGTLAAQRDPRYWGPNPDHFDPDQFATERVLERPRHAFIPFSIGRRQCMAQEVTFMMLRVVLFEVLRRYQLRLAPGATVQKNTAATTKPVAVPVIRIPRRQPATSSPTSSALATAAASAPAKTSASAYPAAVVSSTASTGRDWGAPTEIPASSAYRHIVIAYGSNFGANKELAERFAERSRFHGYTNDVITLNELAERPPRTEPWLLVVMTSTYTSNPPSNATAFRALLQRAAPGEPTWRNCRYQVWGLGNSQWNAFLAFPRYVNARLAELGATRLGELGYADVGSPTWEASHAEWNRRTWPTLLELSGAQATEAAAARVAAEDAARGRLTGADSNTAMTRSLAGGGSAPRVLLVPTILSNTVGIETVTARAIACRELQALDSPKRTRHLEVTLPPGVSYRAGDHLGICPKNDEELVERLARRLGAAIDGLFMVPKTLNVRAVPKGVVLQVRNVLTSLVDISGKPTLGLLDLLLEKTTDEEERRRLVEIRAALTDQDGPVSGLRAALDDGAYDVVRLLDEAPSAEINIFEFLQVAQPLRPRYYSTSSSPGIHGEGVAHVTVGLRTAPIRGIDDREFRGMSSGYVHSLREGDRLDVFLESVDGFHLQDDVSKPMIFVSAGTGFAAMRAFLWERLARKREGVRLAEAVLFNGIRSRQLDLIYDDEIRMFAAEGVLDHVHIAMSREVPGVKEYVQDRIRTEGALVWRLLAEGGTIYICGAQAMREAVRDAVLDVASEHGAMSRDDAVDFLARLEAEGRYRPDVWG